MAKNSKKQLNWLPKEYTAVLEMLVHKIQNAQTRAMIAVNRELMEVYRDIGKTIYEKQNTAEWEDSIVEQLAKDLKNSFPGMMREQHY